jgi:hypothetical protein
MRSWRLLPAVVVLCLISLGRSYAAQAPAEWGCGKPYAYILWDGHRFGGTPEEHERDMQFFKDLGFTHSLITASGLNPTEAGNAVQSKQIGALFKLFDKYDMIAGLRFGWDFSGLKDPWEQMAQKGMTLQAKKTGKFGDYNPIHPDIVKYYSENLLGVVDAYRKQDPAGRMLVLLIGSEYTFGLPKKEQCHPKALELILQAAREDGALGPTEDDWAKVAGWWDGPTSKGRDWRIRKAVSDALRKQNPAFMFMIDPIWCVKLVEGGFGGHWSYVGKPALPEGMCIGAIRTMAQCWPYPATHSTQLINGAYHDMVLEGNLLCLCVGIPSLYHWGVNTFEPGRGANPMYGFKGEKTPDIEKTRRQEIIQKRLDKEPALRSTGRFIRERGKMLHDWKPMEPRVAFLAGLYGPADPDLAMLFGHIPFDLLRNAHHREAELAKYKFVLHLKPAASAEDYAKLLKIEQAGGAVIVPKGFKPPEGAQALTKAVEWDPAIVGEAVTFKKGISFSGGNYSAFQEHVKKGAAHLREVFAKAGFKPYFDVRSAEVVSRAYEYNGHPMLFVVNGKRAELTAAKDDKDDEPEEVDETGAKPAQKNKPAVASQGAIKGVPADIEVFIRDGAAGLSVVDIDTGQPLKLEACPDGQKFKDSIPGAWYKIYAVVKPGQAYQGPPPLKPAPAIAQLAAARGAGGSKLEWKADVQDWVGCDVQWFRVYRGEGSAEPKLLKEIYGRIPEGAGGLVTNFVDETAKAGTAYTYRIQAVSPLRVAGPLSDAAVAKP